MLTNIKKVEDKYIIEKRIHGRTINYGSYDTKTDALKQKGLLVKYKWIKNKSTGYDTKEHFPRYCIRENNQGKYIVKNRKNGRTFGSYKSKKYALIVKSILPFYTNDINIESVEHEAIKRFYRYISHDKIRGYYKFTYRNMVIITHKSLSAILEERDLYLKSICDEDVMRETTEIYRYDENKLPPFPDSTSICYEEKSENKYSLRKKIRNSILKIGCYQTYSLALVVKQYLEDNNWEIGCVNHIIEVTREIQNRDKNIIQGQNSYHISHEVKEKRYYYGSYENIHLARYVRDKLMENNWNTDEIRKYEMEYHHNSNGYYYDRTDILSMI